MSTSRQMGFLSPSLEAVKNDFATKFPLWKSLYLELNEFAVAQFYRIRVDENDKRSVLHYSSYYRALGIYQTVFLVLERGNESEGKALLRNLVETVFILRASVLHDSFYKLFLKFDEKKRIKMYREAVVLHDKRTANNKPSSLTTKLAEDMRRTVANYDLEEKNPKSPLHIVKAVKGQKGVKDIKGEVEPNMPAIAVLADMEDEYIIEYVYLCKYTHLTGFGMDHYLITNPHGSIKSFRAGPSDNDAEANMRVGIIMMLKAVASFADYFKLPIQNEVLAYTGTLRTAEKDTLNQRPLKL